MISLFKILNEIRIQNTKYSKEYIDLLKKYGVNQKWIDLYLIKIDELTPEEMEDLDYVKDRIITHLNNGVERDLKEENITGGTSTFTPGFGENYATPLAFGKRKNKIPKGWSKPKRKKHTKMFDVVLFKEHILNEIQIKSPVKKITLNQFKQLAEKWVLENWGVELGNEFTVMVIEKLKHIKYKSDIIDFLGEILGGGEEATLSLLDIIID